MRYGREVGAAVFSSVVLTVVLFAIIQVPPVAHDNPAVQTTVNWDSAQTEALAARACMDCHSSETNWPWYSYLAPMSWLTTLHVEQGRAQYNLSQLDALPSFRKNMLAEQIAEQIRSGMMPPKDYLLLHPDAQLTDAEKDQLIQGFQRSLNAS